MSQVSTVSSTPCTGGTEVAPRRQGKNPEESTGTGRAAFARSPDRVEFSPAARTASTESGEKEQPIRTDLVQSVRAEIESGQYEDSTKLDIAAERLLKDLGF